MSRSQRRKLVNHSSGIKFREKSIRSIRLNPSCLWLFDVNVNSADVADAAAAAAAAATAPLATASVVFVCDRTHVRLKASAAARRTNPLLPFAFVLVAVETGGVGAGYVFTNKENSF